MYKIILLVSLCILGVIPFVSADVFVPKDEIVTYFDSVGVYTIAGAVKNTENFAITPTLRFTINDDGKQIFITQTLPTVFPNADMPFKTKMPEVAFKNAILEESTVTFEKNPTKSESHVSILYDRSMIKHSDGHLVGRIINNGNQTEYNLKVYATIHGENNTFIDSVQNLEKIDKIEPGQTLEFTMYPDPTLANNVSYYSCFALGDETIIPLSTIRDGKKFDFRYDSTASFAVKGFDDTGTELSLVGINSFKFPTYVNFEFPMLSEAEKFKVLIDEKPAKFIQSKDEYGNWHVAFDMAGSSQNKILISGFTEYDSKTSDSHNTQDYMLVYVVISIAAIIGIAVYVYSKKKVKSTTH